jgi:hypothetical protein
VAGKILNIPQVRADKAVDAPVIIGPDNVRYPVGGIPLDTFFEIVELRQTFADSDGGTDDTVKVIKRWSVLIGEVMPGFPVGKLTLPELMEVIDFMQFQVGPQTEAADAEGEASDSEPGELTPP